MVGWVVENRPTSGDSVLHRPGQLRSVLMRVIMMMMASSSAPICKAYMLVAYATTHTHTRTCAGSNERDVSGYLERCETVIPIIIKCDGVMMLALFCANKIAKMSRGQFRTRSKAQQ